MIHLLHFRGGEKELDGFLSSWLDGLKSYRSAAYFQRKFPQGRLTSGPAAERRRQSAGAWALLEQVLRREYALELAALEIGETVHKKPVCISCPPLFFNLSHCDGLAACIVADRPVGVDCETVRPFSKGVMERVCSPAEQGGILTAQEPEQAFYQHWTLKESFVKAVGTGLSFSLRRAAFLFNEKDICLRLEGPGRPEEEVFLRQYPRRTFGLHHSPPGYWVAGCALCEGIEPSEKLQLLSQLCLWRPADLAQGTPPELL